jgi:hypothetical protein
VFGEVFAPGVTDAQGDRMSAVEIAKAAYLFMEKGRLTKIDTNHDLLPNGSYIVETFIAREGDPTFIAGAWVIGVKVPDPALWSAIKKGELNGFSLDGAGFREEVTLEVEIPEALSGLVSLVKRGANRIPFRLTKEDTNRMLDFVKLFRKSDEEAKPAPSSASQSRNSPQESPKEPPKEEKDPVLAALARLEEGQRALVESIGQLVAKVQKTDAVVSSVVLGEANRDQPVRLTKGAGAGVPRLLDTGLIKL